MRRKILIEPLMQTKIAITVASWKFQKESWIGKKCDIEKNLILIKIDIEKNWYWKKFDIVKN